MACGCSQCVLWICDLVLYFVVVGSQFKTSLVFFLSVDIKILFFISLSVASLFVNDIYV